MPRSCTVSCTIYCYQSVAMLPSYMLLLLLPLVASAAAVCGDPECGLACAPDQVPPRLRSCAVLGVPPYRHQLHHGPVLRGLGVLHPSPPLPLQPRGLSRGMA